MALKALKGHLKNLATPFLSNMANNFFSGAQSSAMDAGKMASVLTKKSPFEIPDSPNEGTNRNPLSFNPVMYPIDLGSKELGHYIIFESGFHGYSRSFVGMGGDIGNTTRTNNPGKITSKTPTHRITTSGIALYMPPNVKVSYKQSFEGDEGGMSADLEGAIKEFVNAPTAGAKLDATLDGVVGPIARRAKEAVGSFASSAGMGDPFRLGMKRAGAAMNPRNEQFYNTPEFRNFTFTFDFWPRNKEEADVVTEIIKIFKYNSSPGLLAKGSMFSIPNYFNIKYMFAEGKNPHLHDFGNCYCTSVDVDYAPDGQYTTFGDGHPVHTKLDVSFVEDKIITKGDFSFTRGSTI